MKSTHCRITPLDARAHLFELACTVPTRENYTAPPRVYKEITFVFTNYARVQARMSFADAAAIAPLDAWLWCNESVESG